MRGRKPSVLSLAPSDEDRLHTTAHSDSLPWYQVRRARILLALAAGQRKRDVAAQMECGVATVWRACERYRRDGLEGLLADGREGRSGRLEQITPVQRAQIVELACLEPIAKGLHITHWSSQDLARQAVEDGIVGSISPATVRRLLHDVDLQPIAPDIGGRPVWMPGSKSERSKSFGAMGMRSDWLNKASGSFVSMRSRPSRFWSVNPFAGRSPARLSNRSSTILGMGP
jgi:transposase